MVDVVSNDKIDEKFGESGMGVVHNIEDLTLTRTIASQSLTHSQKAHEPERTRFLLKAAAAEVKLNLLALA